MILFIFPYAGSNSLRDMQKCRIDLIKSHHFCVYQSLISRKLEDFALMHKRGKAGESSSMVSQRCRKKNYEVKFS